MDKKEAKQLKIGDHVIWDEDGTKGIVKDYQPFGIQIEWSDSQIGWLDFRDCGHVILDSSEE
jgi:hypothetical protein